VVHRFCRAGHPPGILYIFNRLSCQPTHYPWIPSGGWSCPVARNSVLFHYPEAAVVRRAACAVSSKSTAPLGFRLQTADPRTPEPAKLSRMISVVQYSRAGNYKLESCVR